jgi:hypothetical protein
MYPLQAACQPATTPVTYCPNYGNVIVAWADRNYAAAIANPPTPEIKNGLSGRLFTLNNSEVQTSNGRLTLPNQLNIVPVIPAGVTPAIPPAFATAYTSILSNVTASSLANGGFLKFVVDTVDLPVDWVDQGAYSSVVIFNIPLDVAGTLSAPTVSDTYADDNAELAIDTGFFSAN